MKIIVAEVSDTVNFVADGSFYVTTHENNSPIKVQYVSPYLNGVGGFVAIPDKGSRVLICQPDNDEFWYYLGSTPNFGFSGKSEGAVKNSTILPDPLMYDARSLPQRYVFTSPKGNSLILSDSYNPDYFNVKAELRSAAGKALKLIDSPLVDCVILENEHGDKIKITSKANGSNSPRAVEIECKGDINLVTREGSMNLRIVDGKELNIINTSTGSKRSGSNDPTPGNINIMSENADINITTKDDSGSIFLDAQGANSHIILNSKGKITLNGDKGIDITSGGNVTIQGQKIFLN